MTQLKRPYYFTPKVDIAILNLFPFCDTQKLSVLLNLSTQNIIKRYEYLINKGYKK